MKDNFKLIHDNAECEKIIAGTFQGVMAFNAPNSPYAVPLNHAYKDGVFYFHCAVGGKKIDCLLQNASVVYVIQKYFGQLEDLNDAKRCHGKWESVIAYGKARYVEDKEELINVFKIFMQYYGNNDFKPSADIHVKTRAIVMEVEKMTARRELSKKHTEFYEWKNNNQTA